MERDSLFTRDFNLSGIPTPTELKEEYDNYERMGFLYQLNKVDATNIVLEYIKVKNFIYYKPIGGTINT
jgi:hypothetical protein